MLKNIRSRLLVLIFVLIFLVILATRLWLLPDFLLMVPVVAGILFDIFLIVQLYTRHVRKIAFMFNAIESDDYSFNFPEHSGLQCDNMLNEALNRIKKLLEQARSNIVQHEKYYELIMDSVNTGIVVVSESGNIYQTNREAIRLLGLPVFTHIRQLKRIDDHLPDLFKNIQPNEKQQISFSNERGTVHLSIRSSEIIINGKKLRILAINDINSELDEQEIESWIRLIRVLTHEIMNSITPITSLSDTLIHLHGNKDDNIREGLEVISSTGKGLIEFVDSYRRLTRIPTPNMKPFEVRPFLENKIRLSHNNREIKIRLDVKPDELMIYADHQLISQVILNLLKNAVQAVESSGQGEILIRAYCNKEEEILIEINDTGCGIPDEIAQHIFVPFFTTKENGSGIGLSIARQIMRLHNGSISLKRGILPYSTTFILKFN